MVQEFKNEGIFSIIVSHNIYHVYSVSDRIVVLDKGVKILEVPRSAVTPEEIIDVFAHRLDPQALNLKVSLKR